MKENYTIIILLLVTIVLIIGLFIYIKYDFGKKIFDVPNTIKKEASDFSQLIDKHVSYLKDVNLDNYYQYKKITTLNNQPITKIHHNHYTELEDSNRGDICYLSDANCANFKNSQYYMSDSSTNSDSEMDANINGNEIIMQYSEPINSAEGGFATAPQIITINTSEQNSLAQDNILCESQIKNISNNILVADTTMRQPTSVHDNFSPKSEKNDNDSQSVSNNQNTNEDNNYKEINNSNEGNDNDNDEENDNDNDEENGKENDKENDDDDVDKENDKIVVKICTPIDDIYGTNMQVVPEDIMSTISRASKKSLKIHFSDNENSGDNNGNRTDLSKILNITKLGKISMYTAEEIRNLAKQYKIRITYKDGDARKNYKKEDLYKKLQTMFKKVNL